MSGINPVGKNIFAEKRKVESSNHFKKNGANPEKLMSRDN
jgi:hypothetical protein